MSGTETRSSRRRPVVIIYRAARFRTSREVVLIQGVVGGRNVLPAAWLNWYGRQEQEEGYLSRIQLRKELSEFTEIARAAPSSRSSPVNRG